MANLILENVKKSFGSVDVIHGVQLKIEDGEFIVFVGPSGCGKSTLLRMIAGLEEVSFGRIKIGEKDVTKVDPSDRGVAMVFQSYALYPHMNVRENMGFGLKMTGRSQEEVTSRVNKAAEILHLEKLLDRKPKQLSGGQRQRVAIGRAIVRNPEVFLFDEPLSNLDAELRVRMRLEIAKLHKDLSATMIYVTHDQTEAMTLADKIVVLNAGKVEQYGPPLELYDDPANIFVAGFIGSPKMNFLNATVEKVSGNSAHIKLLDFPNASFDFKLSATKVTARQKLLVGVRPEHFDVSGKVKLKLLVDVIEHLGAATYAYASSVESAKMRQLDRQDLIVDLKSDRTIAEGKQAVIGFNPAKAFLFDKNNGTRIK